MAHEFRMVRRVEFAETDRAGIVHFGSYFRYMEETEHAFIRSLGLSIAMEKSHRVGWPRVHASCDYTAPLHFEDEVEIHLRVKEKKERALTYEFVFRRLRPEPAVEVGRGKITTVCVTRDEAGKMRSVPIPDPVARLIEVAP